jgi:hypothetical protein
MSNSTYLAAKSASYILESHFSTIIALAIVNGEQNIATAPSKEIIESIINASFWASLRKEEGNSPKISIAYLTPDEAEQPLVFGKKLLLTPANLTKLAPGVERAGIHLGIWEENGVPYIWGTTLKIPNYCFVLDVSEPGLIVIKHRRLHGFGKFTNVVVIKGDEIKVINKDCGAMKDCPAIVTALLDLDSPCSWNDGVNALIMLAVSMRAHQHGGILLVTPPNSDTWKESIVHPLQYPLKPSFSSLAHLLKEEHQEIGQAAWQSALKSEVENIAGLTAVDGATVITRDLHLLTFGAKIIRKQNSLSVEELAYIEPVLGGEAISKYASEVGGTRHLSAAQFINDQRDAFAMVASQDGYFTVFSWSLISQKVQAHRIETLLL